MSRRRVIALSIAAAGVALPATAFGAISGTVYADYNSNGKRDTGGFVSGSSVTATDGGIAGVVVRAYDNSGAKVGEATTGADGTYSLAASASGTVRVEFTNPIDYEPSFAGQASGSSVQFVSADAKDVDYGIGRPGDFCQDNPKLVTCRQPATNQMAAYPASDGVFTLPGAFGVAQKFTQWGNVFGTETDVLATGLLPVAKQTAIGATFGIGVDKGGNAYLGTYVKRHSPYGPAGNTNAIYRVNLTTGESSTFVDLGGSLPQHSAVAPGGFPAYSQDGLRVLNPGDPGYSNVYASVGRAGLGDLDVTPDGSTLLAVEMTESAPKLWSIPINGSGASASAGTPSSVAIPAPASFGGVSCVGPWHPMGLGVRGSRVLVGGVCGGDETQFVDPNTNRTQAAVFILERDSAGTGFAPIAAFALGYPKGGSGQGETLEPPGTGDTGVWSNWYDGPAGGRGINRPKPMLSNIEIMDNGDLTIGFRDRFGDQIKADAVYYDSASANSPSTQDWVAGAAEMLRLCSSGSGYVREKNGQCNGVTGANAASMLANSPSDRPDSPLYYAPAFGMSQSAVTHPYTGLGGVAMLPGSSVVWSTVFDVSTTFQQGIRALGPCPQRTGDGTCGPVGAADGAPIGGAQVIPTQGIGEFSSDYTFGKGNGLGDLELVCNAAPLQVGNRVWLDENRNGIQDATEPTIAKVTVRLYSAGGTLVGTAVTDDKGVYYFNSNVTEPAAGDGDNVGGGLAVGEAFTIKLDNDADFAVSGPLAGLTLTKVKQTSTSTGAQSEQINSKATTVAGKPQIAGTAHKAGYNDHSFDVGFYKKAVSTGLQVRALTKKVIVRPGGTATARLRYRNVGTGKSCRIRSVVTIARGFRVASKGKATLRGRTLTFTNGKKCLGAGKSVTWTFWVKDTTGKRRCATFPVVTTASDLAKPSKAAMVVCVRGIPVTG